MNFDIFEALEFLIGTVLLIPVPGLVLLVASNLSAPALLISGLYRKHVALTVIFVAAAIVALFFDAVVIYSWFHLYVLGYVD